MCFDSASSRSIKWEYFIDICINRYIYIYVSRSSFIFVGNDRIFTRGLLTSLSNCLYTAEKYGTPFVLKHNISSIVCKSIYLPFNLKYLSWIIYDFLLLLVKQRVPYFVNSYFYKPNETSGIQAETYLIYRML